MAKVRLFTGLPIPQSTLGEFIVFKNIMDKRGGSIRWIPNENLHITTMFIGNMDSLFLPELTLAIKKVTTGFSPFLLSFKKYSTRQRFGKPSMIWAELLGTPEFKLLVRDIEMMVHDIANLKPSNRTPVPHVTLARLKNIDPEIVSSLPQSKVTTLTVGQLILWESELRKGFARYKPLQTFPFLSCKEI